MEPGQRIANRFLIQYEVGSGGMGTVYRALDELTGTPVALKALRAVEKESSARFAREASVLAELIHPRIVRYLAHGVTATGTPYLAMEWLDGITLLNRLEGRERETVDSKRAHAGDADAEAHERPPRRGALTLPETVLLGMQTADGLEELHRRGLVHRDLKPGNLFLPAYQLADVKILDFGLARFVHDMDWLTRTGNILGTPSYMAPEQAQEGHLLDARTDVFALGCVLFECLTGTPPFRATQLAAVMAKLLWEEIPRLASLRPDLPPWVDALLARMLAREPAERPRSGGEVRGLLAEHAREQAHTAAAAPEVARARPTLTGDEQRVFFVLMASLGSGRLPDPTEWATSASTPLSATSWHLSREPWFLSLELLVEGLGGRLEWCGDGGLLVVFSGRAADEVARVAHCALRLRDLRPQSSVGVAAGKGLLSTRRPLGEVVATAGTLATAAPPGSIYVDPGTAALLEAAFLVSSVAASPGSAPFTQFTQLVGRSLATEGVRLLLGRPTACVGRDRELGHLQGLLDESITEPMARAVLVTAPAGVGKSRLKHELLRRAGNAEILAGRGDAMSAGAPFGMIGRALRAAAAIRDGEPRASSQEKLRARLGRCLGAADLERVAGFLGELGGLEFPDQGNEFLRAARHDPRLMGDALRVAFEDWLLAETAAHPVLLVLEDLHLGDLATVKLVDSALRQLADRPFFVLALARPEVDQLFPRLWHERRLQILRLDPLTKKAAEKLVRQVLGDDRGAKVVEHIVARAAGNAFYLEELVRVVGQVGGVGEITDSDTALGELPDTVLGALQVRFDELGQRSKRVIRAASLFGEEFTREGLRSLVGSTMRADELESCLDELEVRELVRSIAAPSSRGVDEERRYSFRHDIVREAAYAMLTEQDRVVGHGLVAAWLEARGDAEALVLASHFERGKETDRAVRWYAQSAGQALGGSDLAAVIRRAEDGVRCGAHGELLGELRLFEAQAEFWLGNVAGARARASEAMTLLPLGSAAWFRAVAEVASAAGRERDSTVLRSAVASAEQTEPLPGATAAKLICLARGTYQVVLEGGPQAAGALPAIEALVLRQTAPDPLAMGHVHGLRFLVDHFAAEDDRSVADSLRSIAAFEEAGDLRNAALERGTLAYLYACCLGDYPRAEADAVAAITQLERLGAEDATTTNFLRCVRGWAVAYRGDVALADKLGRQIAAHAANHPPFAVGVAALYLAETTLLGKDTVRALDHAQRAEVLFRTHRNLHNGALGLLSSALLEAGENEAALAAGRAALEELEAGGGTGRESLVRLAYPLALKACRRDEEAVTAMQGALARITARADRLADAAAREHFFHHYYNARIFAIARDWGLSPPTTPA